MAAGEIDDSLAGLHEPARRSLEALRHDILELLPEAEQGLAYGMPAFRLAGRVVAGFSAARGHVSYLPHSGTVQAGMGAATAGYATSKGALRFPPGTALPAPLVADLIAARRREIDGG